MKPVIRLALTAAALVLGGHAHAQVSFQTLGRLFTTPAERFQLDQQRLTAGPAAAADAADAAGTRPPASGATAMPAPGMPGSAGAAPPPPPPAVQLSGVLRRSNGTGTIWIDGVPQDAPVPSRAGSTGLPVEMDGRRVIMKPGQSYDPNDGTVRNQP